MSQKRSRAAYEADSQAVESHFVVFGTPLPVTDSHTRDDGSYVPIHKQEVRDAQGRRRLHGAFTGGWSAGYFNTVGSKEGWTPATFVSSRQARHADHAPKKSQQRPEDFMDEEDLADVAEAEKIQTANAFAGIGGVEGATLENSGLMDLVHPRGDTMGFSLLRKMGWRDGQGIGPKVRRAARLHHTQPAASSVDTHLFAPDDVVLMGMARKVDRAGLGNDRKDRELRGESTPPRTYQDVEEDTRPNGHTTTESTAAILSVPFKNPKKRVQRGGIGIGVLNDTGSDDDDDPYSMGPRISFNRTLGSDKSKKSKSHARALTANPALGAKLTFTSKRGTGVGLAKCRDGLPPLPGFSLSSETYSTSQGDVVFPPPLVPRDWTPRGLSEKSAPPPTAAPMLSGAAQVAGLDPKSRAAALGEVQLPGKSVFDFMSADARARVAAASGKSNLPAAKSEIPSGYSVSAEQRLKEGIQELPRLEKETAIAAIARGRNAGAPYADNEAKQSRYRTYLEHVAYGSDLPMRPADMTVNEFVKELGEFYGCARLFKPLTGFMASRFTAASTTSLSGSHSTADTQEGATRRAPPESTDPVMEAAKMGVYGQMTRSTEEFYPSRLLCKRFNVRPPDHVAAAPSSTAAGTSSAAATHEAVSPGQKPAETHETRSKDERLSPSHTETASGPRATVSQLEAPVAAREEPTRPDDDVFRAIFGDSSDEDQDG